MHDEGLRQVEAEPGRRAKAVVSEGEAPAPVEVEALRPDAEQRVQEVTRALTATRERESDFRQAAFDLNAELLKRDDELETLRERLGAAEAQAAELPALRSRVAELERLMQTRAFRVATSWWRMKARIFRR